MHLNWVFKNYEVTLLNFVLYLNIRSKQCCVSVLKRICISTISFELVERRSFNILQHVYQGTNREIVIDSTSQRLVTCHQVRVHTEIDATRYQ